MKWETSLRKHCKEWYYYIIVENAVIYWKVSRLFIVHSIFRDVFIQCYVKHKYLVTSCGKKYIIYITIYIKVIYMFGDYVIYNLFPVLFCKLLILWLDIMSPRSVMQYLLIVKGFPLKLLAKAWTKLLCTKRHLAETL